MPIGIYKRIKPVSMETKIKMSSSQKGHHRGGWKFSKEAKNNISKAHKGINTWMIGVKRSEETKKKMSKSHKGRKHTEEWNKKVGDSHRGEKSVNWKGGVTPENKKIRNSIDFKLWRIAVFARDNWTCQKTGIKGGKLHPHHIQNFSQHPELRFAIDNGITLSEKSHKEFHKIYGKKNNTYEQLNEFLNKTICQEK